MERKLAYPFPPSEREEKLQTKKGAKTKEKKSNGKTKIIVYPSEKEKKKCTLLKREKKMKTERNTEKGIKNNRNKEATRK